MTISMVDVLNEHGPALVRVVANYAAPGPDRDDLRQDVLVAIHRALPRFRGEASLRTFVLRIAHNRGASFAVKRNPALPTEDDPHFVDPGRSPEEELEQRRRWERLTSGLRQLPLNQRQALSLALEGLPHREIAAVLGVSENAVAVRLHRARRALRELLGADDG